MVFDRVIGLVGVEVLKVFLTVMKQGSRQGVVNKRSFLMNRMYSYDCVAGRQTAA